MPVLRRSGKTKKSPQGRLRIVAGIWRSRVLEIADAPGLRPTSERIRETLFNWLAPVIKGAHCLDLFCGSGALGLEALSRGAAQVSFVDRHTQAIEALKETCQRLDCDRADFYPGKAQDYLQNSSAGNDGVDIAFIDPPYTLQLQAEMANLLDESGCLSEQAWIYIEHDGGFKDQKLPQNWIKHREKVAGQVHYTLYRNHQA